MMPQDQSMPQEPAMDGQADGSYTICLNVSGDGKLSVSVDSAASEAAEPPAQEATETGEEDAQPVADIREAIKLILDIFQNAGKSTDPGAEKSQMEAGYK